MTSSWVDDLFSVDIKNKLKKSTRERAKFSVSKRILNYDFILNLKMIR